MITTNHRAGELFTVRQKGALTGNPEWANLAIDSNKTLPKHLARGAGLYAIHFHGALVYVGKFCGTRSSPFEGRICDIRWARHIGTLTLRDRRISLSRGRCEKLRSRSEPPLVDIVNSMPAETIYQHRGRATSINRALFASEHWAEFVRIQDASGLGGFSITYTQIEAADGVDPTRIRSIVSQAEAEVIDRLQPRCNREVREGLGRTASIAKVGEVFAEVLAAAIAEAGNGQPLQPPRRPDLEEGVADDGVQGSGNGDVPPDPEDPEGPDDPPDPTAEELFWEKIDGEPTALAFIHRLVEGLSEVMDADLHFTYANSGDLRVHSLAGPRARFNVARVFWQPKLRRFSSEIYLPPGQCLAFGATTARQNYVGKPLPTIATFDLDCAPDALWRCVLAALSRYQGHAGG